MSQSYPTSTPPGQAGAETAQAAAPESGISQQLSAMPPALAGTLSQLEAAARDLEGQPEALLALLRSLEQLHRSIQDGPFRASLPADRNALFRLLSEMERSGGWPYIPRLQLRTFLDLLGQGAGGDVLPQTGDEPQQDIGAASHLAA